MGTDGQHCSFVLLSEFDIDQGPKLTYQFPQPLGTDEGLIANLMLPDGAEKQLEDWTIFFLNQTPFNTIAPVLALETVDLRRVSKASLVDEDKPELLYVLNLVRTKHDKTVKRGAVVKAMAICTRHPFIQIFKPVLLMALDDYYSNPSQDCLARLFDAINSMDLSAAPSLTRHEKLVMRHADRKDIFAEKHAQVPPAGAPKSTESSNSDSVETLAIPPLTAPQTGKLSSEGSNVSLAPQKPQKPHHRTTNSWDSRTSIDEGIVMRGRDQSQGRERSATESTVQSIQSTAGQSLKQGGQPSPSDSSFGLDGSTVWVGNESGLETAGAAPSAGVAAVGGTSGLGRSKTFTRGRSSTDASSSSGHGGARRDDYFGGGAVPTVGNVSNLVKDTLSFQTFIDYNGFKLPIKMPLSTFPEEVGEYSVIEFIKTFSSPGASVQGPLHPHLHSNGALTHPIILLFNALVTNKRIIFLGHNNPAGKVSNYVLSACALGSGCGAILRGYIERAFPYANLINREEWESIPGYIAGVTNPIFESFDSWDVLCDISSGRIVVSKDIITHLPPSPTSLSGHALILRTGTLKAETSVGSEEEMTKAGAREGVGASKNEYVAKADSHDSLFIEDVIVAISNRFSEELVRIRVQEYGGHFVRLAARYEEEVQGQTSIGYASSAFSGQQLGSGFILGDEATTQRELLASASRIEAFQKTNAYQYCQADFQKSLASNPLHGFDVHHQLTRLRNARHMSDAEVELIMRTFADQVQSYPAVVELLSYLPFHRQRLLPLSLGLFHQQEAIRDLTVDLFEELRQYPVGVSFLQCLNHFQRYAYIRQAQTREVLRQMKEQHQPTQLYPPSTYNGRAPSNRSETSLGGG